MKKPQSMNLSSEFNFLSGKTLAFLGVKPQDLYGYESFKDETELPKLYKKYMHLVDELHKVAKAYYEKGFRNFITTMNIGMDFLMVPAINRLRKEHDDIKIFAYLPCKSIDKKWEENGFFSKNSFRQYLNSCCDEVSFLSEDYTDKCIITALKSIIRCSNETVFLQSTKNTNNTFGLGYYAKTLGIRNLSLIYDLDKECIIGDDYVKKAPEEVDIKNINNYVVFDTETTGLSNFDEILQFSAVTSSGETFNTYIKPKKRKTWIEAEKINGISPKMVENAPTIDEVAPKIKELFDQADVIIGHNAPFDIRMTTQNMGYDFTDKKIFDTCAYHRKNFNTKKHNLLTCVQDLLPELAEDFEKKTHDSSEDTYITMLLFKKMQDIAKENELNEELEK